MSDLPLVNLRLERDVLGRMLSFSGALAAYLGSGLAREDFYRKVHQDIYDAIVAVDGSGALANMVTVRMELRKRGLLEDVGGDRYLGGLTTEVMPTDSASMLLEVAELATLAGKRDIAAAVEREDFAELASRVDLAANRGADEQRIYDSVGQLGAIADDSARDAKGRIFLGMPTLDNTLEGIRAGEVLGLLARPGIGKTLVLCHVTRSVAEQEAFAHVFFSLEMPAPQIVDRLASAHFDLSRHQFRERLSAGVLDGGEYTRTFQRFVLVDAPGLSVAQMAAKLRQIQAGPLKGIPIRLITIDHLGLIGGDRRMTTYDRVSTQAREIKELAKRWQASVVLAVQVNREAGGDGSKELGLGAARDSGVVEEAMDYLIAMRRLDRSQSLQPYEREKYRDVLFCKVIKNRHGTPDTEVAMRIQVPSLNLREDPDLQPDASDLSKITNMPLRGRR